VKIKVVSDDGKKTVEVATEDIDFAGHSMNRVVLELRFRSAVNEVANYEQQPASIEH
jgi:hypothetical protein